MKTAEPDLRRADWRFLLPAPPGRSRFERLVLLGGSPSLRVRLRDTSLADVIDDSLAGTCSPDAVAVMHDADRQIPGALHAVAPGGVFYAEVDRRRSSTRRLTPGRMLRLMRDAGVTPVALHWVIPDFDTTKRYLPLDAPRAVEWYLKTAPRRSSPARALGASLIWTVAGRDAGHLASVVPCFSVIGIRSPGSPPVPAVLTHPDVAAHFPGVHGRVMLVTSGRSEASRVVLVPFDDAGPARAVVKLSRAPRFNQRTIREQATLYALRTRLGPSLADTVPTPYWCGDWHDLGVAIESHATGPTILVSSSRWPGSARERIADLARAASWLSRFHREWLCSSDPFTKTDCETFVGEPLTEYALALGASPAEAQLFDGMRALAVALCGKSFPIVLQHRDFGPWNIHCDDDRVTVIDWEFDGASPMDRAGPALMDLVYFTAHWMFAARRLTSERQRLDAFRELFVDRSPHDPFVRAARHELAMYMAALALEPAFLPLLVALTWIQHAVAFASRDADRDEGNPYVPYVRILATYAELLFPLRAAA